MLLSICCWKIVPEIFISLEIFENNLLKPYSSYFLVLFVGIFAEIYVEAIWKKSIYNWPNWTPEIISKNIWNFIVKKVRKCSKNFRDANFHAAAYYIYNLYFWVTLLYNIPPPPQKNVDNCVTSKKLIFSRPIKQQKFRKTFLWFTNWIIK